MLFVKNTLFILFDIDCFKTLKVRMLAYCGSVLYIAIYCFWMFEYFLLNRKSHLSHLTCFFVINLFLLVWWSCWWTVGLYCIFFLYLFVSFQLIMKYFAGCMKLKIMFPASAHIVLGLNWCFFFQMEILWSNIVDNVLFCSAVHVR